MEFISGQQFGRVVWRREPEATIQNRIEVTPDIHFGKPCVAGTRITVHSVLELIREGIPADQIQRDFYPDLVPDDIRACVQYAMDVISLEDIRPAISA